MEFDQKSTNLVRRARGVGERFDGVVRRPEAAAVAVEDDPPISTIEDLAAALEALGWPEPTEWTATSFRWLVTVAGKIVQVGAWFGPELERVEGGIEDEPQFRPTGRTGVFVTGERSIRATLGEALAAFERAFERAPDELLRLFGLRHDHLFPKSPVVPIDFEPTPNERGDMLRSIGQI